MKNYTLGNAKQIYPYVDENGSLLFHVARFEPKSFIQFNALGQPTTKGVRRVPYKLPKILEAANRGTTIYIVEGEKDVHTAESLGLVATCNPMGAGKWKPEYSEHLQGANVVLIPDQDETGENHVRMIASTLAKKAKSLQICRPQRGKDLTDWIEQGGTLEEIEANTVPMTFSIGIDRQRQNEQGARAKDFEELKLPYHVAELFTQSPDGKNLIYWRANFYQWNGKIYERIEIETVRSGIYRMCTAFFSSKLIPQFAKSYIDSVLDAIKAITQVSGSREAPFWIDGLSSANASELVAVNNGLLDISSGRIVPFSPSYFCLSCSPVVYDPAARPPKEWLSFLESLWKGDQASIDSLQEWFGLFMSNATHFQKALLLIGPKRSGKSTIARVLSQLVGNENISSPTLGGLSQHFGLESLIHKKLISIADTRFSHHRQLDTVVENLLKITGEDSFSIPRKYVANWEGRITGRILVISNELPTFADASGALASRFIVIKTMQSFFGSEDLNLQQKLTSELTGILNWALEGWRRLRSQGQLSKAEYSDQMIEELQDIGSPIKMYVEERCTLGPNMEVPVPVLFRSWQNWCDATGNQAGNIQSFGKSIRAFCPMIRVKALKVDSRTERVYLGIGFSSNW